MTKVYLLFAVLGAIIPGVFFARFMLDQGWELTKFVRQLFANFPAGGFTSDLLITSVVFWICRSVKHVDRKRRATRTWRYAKSIVSRGNDRGDPPLRR